MEKIDTHVRKLGALGKTTGVLFASPSIPIMHDWGTEQHILKFIL